MGRYRDELTVAGRALWVVASVSLFGWSCARQMPLTGGQMDTLAPRIVRLSPPQPATDFKSDKIRIQFNEYTQLQDPQKNLYVSPPLKYPIEPTLRGKGVQVKINDTLAPSRTYVLHFRNGLKDLTEGNTIQDYSYVFSTGPTIDSNALAARSRDAFTHEPIPELTAMLFPIDTSYNPLDSMPAHVSRADSAGQFSFIHLPEGQFRLVVVEDKNNNFRYDAGERMGFLVEPLESTRMPRVTEVPDSLRLDSTQMGDSMGIASDSTKKDSLRVSDTLRLAQVQDTATVASDSIQGVAPPPPPKIEPHKGWVSIYTPLSDRQLLTDRKRSEAEYVGLYFSAPVKGEVEVKATQPAGARFSPEWNATHDSLTLWMLDTVTALSDSMQFLVSYQRTDSLGKLQPQTDTARLPLDTKKTKRRPPSLRSFERAGGLRPGDTLWLESNLWVTEWKTDSVRLLVGKDSVGLAPQIIRSEDKPRRIGVYHEWMPDSSYQLRLPLGVARSVWQLPSDSSTVSLKAAVERQSTHLHIAVSGSEHPLLLQLYTDKQSKATIEQEVWQPGDTATVKFRYLTPATFGLRIVEDADRDGKWTPGDYGTQRLPERVKYFVSPEGNAEIRTRQGWTYDLVVDFKQLGE